MRSLIFAAALWAALPVSAQNSGGSAWKNLEFLLGHWIGVTGEKDSQPGAGQGAFSFELQLDRKIMVRRNHAGYDSGAAHDDLMVIYLDPPDATPRAIDFDSEGHVIRYHLAFPSANTAVFETDETQPGPRYRLSYRLEQGSLNGKFEIAQSGAGYQTYLSWTSRKE